MSPVHKRHHAIMQIEPAQNFLGASQHALVLILRLFRRGDGDKLDLGELVLPDHAASILARRPRLGTEARRAGREPHRQLRFVDDRLADEIGQRHFGGGDQPEIVPDNSDQYRINLVV